LQAEANDVAATEGRSRAERLHVAVVVRGGREQRQARTNDPLVPFEQVGLGGLDTVRGYYEQEALVDSGGGIQTELRSPSFADRLGADAVNEARVHLFADTAAGTNHLSLPGTTSHVVLGCVGVGPRVRVFDVMNAEVQNAIALSDGPNTKSGTDNVLFRLFGEF
jgi:hemolysin activation/secretion protein